MERLLRAVGRLCAWRSWTSTAAAVLLTTALAGQEIAIGQVVEDEIWGWDTRLYEVQIDTQDYYVIRVAGASTNSSRWSLWDSTLSVRDADGNSLYWADEEGPGHDPVVEMAWLDPGRYTIEVQSGYSGTYAISLVPWADHQANRPNFWVSSSEVFALLSDGGVNLHIDASGPGNMVYHWLRNDDPWQWAYGPDLWVYDLYQGMSDTYRLVVSNDVTAAESDPIRVRAVDQLGLGETRAAYYENSYAHGEATAHYYQVSIPTDGTYRILVQDAEGFHDWQLEYWGGNLGYSNGVSPFVTEAWLYTGDYRIRLSANEWLGIDYTISIEVAGPPVITAQPQPQSVLAGQIASFSVAATGSGLAYQWARDGVDIPGATDATLDVPTSDTSLNGSIYHVVITNAEGSTQSSDAILSVRPVVTGIALGETLVGIIDPAYDADAYRFEVTLSGAYDIQALSARQGSFSTLPYARVDIADTRGNVIASADDAYISARVFVSLAPGSYFITVRATDYYYYRSGTGTYRLSVQTLAPPSVTSQPVAVSVVEGQRATFSVVGSSPAPMSYQWLRNGVAMGAYGSSLTIQAGLELDGSAYTVQVSNIAGSVLSDPAILQVSPAPTLAVGQSITAAIDPATDIDWYRVSIDTAGYYVVNVAGVDSGVQRTLANPVVELLDAAGNRIALDDDSGPGRDPSLPRLLAAGSYTVAVSSYASASVGTYTVSLLALAPPTITVQPQSQTIIEGQSTNVVVTAASPAPLSYQWSRNGDVIPGATSATYVAATTGRTWDGSQFRVTVSNMAGSVTSDAATLQVQPAPSIAVGQSLTGVLSPDGDCDWYRITISEAGGYQFTALGSFAGAGYTLIDPYLQLLDANGTVITSADDGAPSSYGARINRAMAPGDYILAVRSNHYSASYRTGTYGISAVRLDPPLITTQPASITIVEGQSTTLRVIASSLAPLSYQWSRNGSPISGATGSTYAFAIADTSLSGSVYQVTITNVAGSTTSQAATLTVQPAPTLAVGETQEGAIAVAGEVDWYRFTITTAGGYQLAVAAAGTDAARWTLANPYLQLLTSTGSSIAYDNDSGPGYDPLLGRNLTPGSYIFAVASEYTSYTGTYAVSVQPLIPPSVTTQPASVTIVEGQSATFSVVANSSTSASYQWTRNGTSIAGATSQSYTIATSDTALSGSAYRVVVTNAAGSVTSDPATLTVEPAPTLAVGASLNGTIARSGEVDWYRFTIDGAGGYQVTVSGVGTDAAQWTLTNPYLRVLAASGSQIAADDNSGPGNDALLGVTLAPGSYILAAQANGSGIGTYGVALQPLIPPSIITQPIAVTIVEGQTATFGVVASSTTTASYQWTRNGASITGATAAIYTITTTDTTLDASVYRVTVTNAAGSVESDAASLSVQPAPTLAVGETKSGAIAVPGEVDWYRVTIAQGGGYLLTVAGAGTDAAQWSLVNPYVQVQTALGSVVGADDNSGPGNDAQLGTTLPPGSFIVIARAVGSTQTGTYAVSLQELTPPVITSQPASAGIVEGQSATFSVIATSTTPATYQWSRDGVAIAGATAATYTVTTSDTALQGSVFTVAVTNAADTVLSAPATLTVQAAPTIAVGQTIEGALAVTNEVDWYRFTIATPGGYQVAVAGMGSDGARWTLADPQVQVLTTAGTVVGTDDNSGPGNDPVLGINLAPGSYIAVVRAAVGTLTGSYAVSLQEVIPPAITTQPASMAIVEGQSTTFTVVASSTTAVSYQWSRAGSAIAGATGASLSVSTTDTSLTGSVYQVTVTNAAGSVLSDAATLTVLPAPTLALGGSADGVIALPGEKDWYRIVIAQRSTYQIGVAGAGTDAAQWSLADSYATLFTNALGTLAWDDNSGPGSDALLSATIDPGSYIVEIRSVASNQTGTYRVSLVEIAAPTIATQPADATIVVGQSATFTVAAAGPGPLSYQWTRDGSAIGGATGSSYSVSTSDRTLDGAVYRVVVSNPAGSITSAAAILHVADKAPQAITGFDALPGRTFGDAPFTITGATGGASGNPVLFTSSNPAVATVSGSVITIQGAGTAVITASQAGNALYAPAPPVAQTLVVARAAQTITFPALANRPFGTSPFTVEATASSGLTVAFTVQSGPGSLTGAQLTMTDIGPIVISATQAGNANYLAAASVAQALLVTQSGPIIAAHPAGRDLAIGASATIQVTVANPVGATYAWFRDGMLLAGATLPELEVTAAEAGAVSYHVVVGNRFGEAVSQSAVIRAIYVPVAITQHPASASVPTGGTASFSVAATGSQPISVQWQRDGIAIPGATNSTYTTPALSFADHGGHYVAVVTNAVGSVASNQATLTVQAAPQIGTHPVDAHANAGDTAFFTVQAVGTPTLHYQWLRNAQSIPGATAATLSLATGATDDGAQISVRVSNAYGSITSTAATLHITVLPPAITTQPSALTIGVGESAVLTVGVRSALPVTYAWYRDGVAIADATGAQFTVVGQEVGESDYHVVITGDLGAVTSANAHVTVINRPVQITTQPQAFDAAIGQQAVFTIVAQGTAPLSYQWLRDGAAIPGATAAAYTTGVLGSGDDGAVIAVDVTNISGTVRSSSATLRVHGPPVIIAPPVDVTLYEGSPASFAVTADSRAPMTYQWFRNGQVIVGATGRTFATAAVTPADAGASFTVAVANLAGTTLAGPALLQVQARLSQTITGFAAFVPQVVGAADLQIIGVVGGASNNPVTFATSDSTVAQVLGANLIRIVGAGTATITAHQDGNALYAPAPPVAQILTVDRGSQSITFPEVRSQPLGGSAIVLAASASSRLPVAFAVVDGPGTYADGKLSLDGVGDVHVVATQAGNTDFQPAEPVIRVVRIESIAPVIVKQPQSSTAPVGDQVPMSVSVANARFATYQWFRNSTAIAGATSAGYAATAPVLGATDTYRVEVSNAAGTTVSADATITGMTLHPAIVDHPQPATIYAGETTTFTVGVRGSEPLTYQWFRDGVAIDGAIGAVWTTPAVSAADDQAHILVAVSNGAGTAVSDAAMLRVHAPPRFLRQPAGVQVNVGEPATLSALVDSTMPVTYQWLRDGVPILGAHALTYAIAETAVADDGAVFRLSAANALGVTLSDPAVLRATITAPVFTQQPVSVILAQPGDEAAFQVAVRSALPVTFQWYRNDEAITGATTARYAFIPSGTDIGAVFTVIAGNDVGSTVSANATVSQVAKPVITGQPGSRTVVEGGNVGLAVLAISFDPARVLTYQWRRNGVDIPGATSSSLNLSNVALALDGSRYTVLVADGPATRLSNEAVLHVVPADVVEPDQSPASISNLSDVIVDPGESATFSVVVWGASPIAIQWYRNGEPIPGASSAIYRTPPVMDADYGTRFHATATNAYGAATTTEARISPLPLITSIGAQPSNWPYGSVNIPVGDPVTFSANVRGARPIAFRWFRNGVEIPGADRSTYVVPAVSVADDRAQFTVTASNTAGEASRDLPPLYVFASAPIIETEPQDQSVPYGQTATFTVGVSSHAQVPVTYQWYRDGVAIVGETGSAYALRAMGDADLTARFHVVATNRFGSATSRQARVTRMQPLAITKQPLSTSVDVGDPATFSVVVNQPSIAGYYWRKNGIYLPFIHSMPPTYTTPLCVLEDHGAVFDVVVRGPYGQELVSDAVMLSVVDNPPSIVVQPKAVQATIGQNAIFTVTAAGREPLSYRWFRDGQPIDDQTVPSLSVPVLSLSDDGARFHVVVSNERGTVTSQTVTLGARFIPATVISDPDTVAEIHGDSVLIHPRAYVSNGDRNDIYYRWSQLSGPSLPQASTGWGTSARLSLTGLTPGSYALRCSARYGFLPVASEQIDDTYHIFRFQVTRGLSWVTVPRMVGALSASLAVRIEAVAGFNGLEDPATSYDWSQIGGPAAVTFAVDDVPAAKQSQVQLPERGRYLLSCTATWRDTRITRQLIIDTEAESEEQDDAATLATLQKRSLLIAAVPFDAVRWSENADFRTAYLAGVEPGRVWQSAPAGGGRPALRSADALRRVVAAGSEVTLRVQTVADAPVSWASLHGGVFAVNGLNAITVAANATGEATIAFQAPRRSGTYVVLAASPLTVGRVACTLVVP